jgi:hypothetical protein
MKYELVTGAISLIIMLVVLVADRGIKEGLGLFAFGLVLFILFFGSMPYTPPRRD